MTNHILAAGAALLALAGCGQGSESEPSGNTAIADASAGASAATADVAAPAAAAAVPAGQVQDGPSLLLAADGIMPGGDAQNKIPFGANSLDTVEEVTLLLGKTYDSDESAECGAGPMEFASWDKLVLMFQSGEFVGWELREASDKPGIAGPGGLTIGSPRSALDAALPKPLTVEESTLGIEFYAGGFSGLLSDATPSAKVTALWAGTNCAMR